MTDTFATVGYDSDNDNWTVCYGDRIDSEHTTKKDAISAAKQLDTVNTVMAFTKGNSNFNTIRC